MHALQGGLTVDVVDLGDIEEHPNEINVSGSVVNKARDLTESLLNSEGNWIVTIVTIDLVTAVLIKRPILMNQRQRAPNQFQLQGQKTTRVFVRESAYVRRLRTSSSSTGN